MRKLPRSIYLGLIALVFAVPVADAAQLSYDSHGCAKDGALTICKDGSFAIQGKNGIYRVFAPDGRTFRVCGFIPKFTCSQSFMVDGVQSH